MPKTPLSFIDSSSVSGELHPPRPSTGAPSLESAEAPHLPTPLARQWLTVEFMAIVSSSNVLRPK